MPGPIDKSSSGVVPGAMFDLAVLCLLRACVSVGVGVCVCVFAKVWLSFPIKSGWERRWLGCSEYTLANAPAALLLTRQPCSISAGSQVSSAGIP